jgi:hypothetical protein
MHSRKRPARCTAPQAAVARELQGELVVVTGGRVRQLRHARRAVGAEQREDRSLGDVQIDAVEHEVVAERLSLAGRRDR